MSKTTTLNEAKDVDDPKRSLENSNAGSRKRATLIAAIVTLVVVLALGLGLGLGLGLKHKGSKSPSSSSSSSAPTSLEPWRRSTLDYTLDTTSWDINAAPTTRVYNLSIGEITAAPDGVVRQLIVINGQFPGPLIRANRGDRLLINVTNTLSNATTLHWHGMFQRGTNWMDGSTGITQCPIPPGRSFMYNFTVADQYGTYWYHSHYSTQYTDGVVGPLIIHAPEEAQERKSYDVDQVVLLSDWYHDLSAALLPDYLSPDNENTEPVPDNGLIQGTNYFNCSLYASDSGYDCQSNSTRAMFPVSQGKKYRLRLINTSAFGNFQFSIDNHTLSVIEADGTLLQPADVHRLELAVAQRYSVILNANQKAANFWIRAQLNTFCFADSDILNPDVRGIISYSNTTDEPKDDVSRDWADATDTICKDLDTKLLVPAVTQQAPKPDVVFGIDVSFQIKDYALDRAYVNSTSWRAASVPTLNQAVSGLKSLNGTFNASSGGLSTAYDTSQFVIDVSPYRVVDLLVNNLDEGSHPFHLHGHTFWIMAQNPSNGTGYFDWNTYGSLNVANPMRRDTLTIEGYGWALIRFVADNPGLWAFHCHISWHMEAGLLMQFQARNDIMKTWTLPSDVLALCTA